MQSPFLKLVLGERSQVEDSNTYSSWVTATIFSEVFDFTACGGKRMMILSYKSDSIRSAEMIDFYSTDASHTLLIFKLSSPCHPQ